MGTPNPDFGKSRIQVSVDGGRSPVWGPNLRELFFLNSNALMRIEVDGTEQLRPEKPVLVVRGETTRRERQYDIHPDGQRFLMIERLSETDPADREIIVVTNWFEELDRLMPLDRACLCSSGFRYALNWR
jgi:hypothetical protein